MSKLRQLSWNGFPPPGLVSRLPFVLGFGALALASSALLAGLSSGLEAGPRTAALCLLAAGITVLLRAPWRALRSTGSPRPATAERHYRALSDHSAVGIWHMTPEGKTLSVNPAVREMLQLAPEDSLVGVSFRHFFTSASLEAYDRDRERRRRGQTATYEATLVGRRGGHRTVRISGVPILDDSGRLESVIATLVDRTAHRTVEAELARRALHDPLTELPNRHLLMERLELALARSVRRFRRTRHSSRLALLHIDLDRFKVINDSLGYAAGDEILVAIGERLQRIPSGRELLAHLGGDDFVLLLEGPTQSPHAAEGIEAEPAARATAERILEVLAEPVEVQGTPIRITASIGIALSAPPDMDGYSTAPEELLRRAGLALGVAQAQGGGGAHLYAPREDGLGSDRLQVESALWQAAARGELELHYQPIAELTGRRASTVGVEALVRWRHPQRGLVPPRDFIPLAEETGAIEPIGQWVIEEACRQLGLWRRRFPHRKPLYMAINLSARQFGRPDLVGEITRILLATGTDPQDLCFEITESMLLRDPSTVGRLKRLGVRIAIDDFATGYSCLAALRQIEVDQLKIDRSFTAGIPASRQDTALVTAVVHLARALDLQVTAEGVETPEQLATVRSLGCHYAQGFLISGPLPAVGLASFLEAEELVGRRSAQRSAAARSAARSTAAASTSPGHRGAPRPVRGEADGDDTASNDTASNGTASNGTASNGTASKEKAGLARGRLPKGLANRVDQLEEAAPGLRVAQPRRMSPTTAETTEAARTPILA